jgi:hypothetical protein
MGSGPCVREVWGNMWGRAYVSVIQNYQMLRQGIRVHLFVKHPLAEGRLVEEVFAGD